MPDKKFLSIERCGGADRKRVILWMTGIIASGIIFTAYSPFEYLFHQLGYKDSNGCPLLTLAGVPCPLCGMGRSFWALVKLDTGHIFYYNPSGVFFFLISGVILGGVFMLAVFGYRIRLRARAWKLWYVFAGVIVLMWVLNIVYGHH